MPDATPDAIDLEIATPERLLVKERVSEAQIPAKSGYIGVLPEHAPLLSELGTGLLSYTAGGKKKFLSIQGGFVEVLPNQVRVLANMAERSEEIDSEAARIELRRAEYRLCNPAVGVDPAAALEDIALAQARIAATEKK